MARKKKADAQEEVQETKHDPSEDIKPKRNLRQEKEDREASEFLGEEVKEGKVVDQDDEVVEEKEETPEETPVVEAKIEEKPEEPGVEFDPEKLKSDIIAEIDERLPKQTKEEEVKRETVIDKVLAKAKAEGRNPTWEEAITALGEQSAQDAYDRLKKEQEEAGRVQEEARHAQEEEAKQVEAQNEKAKEEYNKILDEDLADLYRSGKLERIKNADDETDTGVIQRKALFQKMYDVNVDRASRGLRPIYSIKEIYYEHYKNPVQQQAGADAPVNLGKSQAKPEDPESYSYFDIHGKDYASIIRGR